MSAAYPFSIELGGANGLEYHLPNEKDKFGKPIPHREAVTGSDRRGDARFISVSGLMPTVVHGYANDEPHTLIIFEWNIASERNGLRFKEVTIEISFEAHGTRGQAEFEAQELRQRGFSSNYWDPEVVSMVPTGTQWFHPTQQQISDKSAFEIGFSADFASFLSVGPKYTFERNTSLKIADSIQVTGRPFVVGSGRNRPNAVRWTLLENKSQRSGVPAYLRTAVLLKRQVEDTGLFLGRVEIQTHVSWLEDMKESVRKMKGDIPLDEPIIFDPELQSSSTLNEAKTELDSVDLDSMFRILTLHAPPAESTEAQNEGSG